ncbi:hypothetical protein ZIOFF_034563 [Zingiber officinale]|uniref:Retrovirus-related Pol polyprotein from transposon TNT 1-94-like beta-barrel domain-containing protein n=1 Tax=Zingiber officinale TaxID=94328 RepID=A0A8J5GL93_ZINOF|nr:hypothetical protein ZIOFF_034563 [Zingiber officinale]
MARRNREPWHAAGACNAAYRRMQQKGSTSAQAHEAEPWTSQGCRLALTWRQDSDEVAGGLGHHVGGATRRLNQVRNLTAAQEFSKISVSRERKEESSPKSNDTHAVTDEFHRKGARCRKRRSKGDAGVGGREGGVEQGGFLFVAGHGAGLPLDPRDAASGVEDEGLVLLRSAETDGDDIFTATESVEVIAVYSKASFSTISPPVFDGDNYQIWAVRMETYLDALDLWEALDVDYEIPVLPANPTMAKIKVHKEKKTKKSKAKACLFAAVSATIFSRIMSLQTAKEIWDYLKSEYEGDERIRGMQVLNLICDFEMQKMKKTETIKEYADRLLGIANRVRLLGSSLTDSRIVEKILVTLPERFEATITTFENTKDLTRITLAELLNALQAQEQKRAMRREGEIEGALPARHNDVGNFRKQKNKNPQAIGEDSLMGNKNKAGDKKAGANVNYPPCHHCGKKGHPPFKCWRRPDAKCRKCNQMGHEAVICKKKNPQQEEEAKVADQDEFADQDEDQLFVATCFASNVETESWLIDSGCTNHMTNDKELFKDLHPTKITKVRIGNGDYISVKGKGTVAITSCSGTKLISEVLFVPEIHQNLLSVGQLIEKGFKVVFEDNFCLIKDAANQDIFKIKMKGKSFALKPLEEEQTAFSIRENVTEIWHKRLGHYHH